MFKIAVVPGDHIGPDIIKEGLKVLKAISKKYDFEIDLHEFFAGGVAIDKFNNPLPEETIEGCREADAILFGAVGGPKWDDRPWYDAKDTTKPQRGILGSMTPQRGIVGLRKEFDLFANIRPAYLYESLVNNLPVKPEIAKGCDFIVVRELCGGVYSGEPRGIYGSGEDRYGTNAMRYSVKEIRRVAHIAFKIAQGRNKKVTSVDKANVIENSVLWREIVKEVANDYPDVSLNHLYADATSMKFIQNPLQFDVIVTGNVFGDILSDLSSVLTGSLGMMPSASLRNDKFGLYEPIHGSAPDIEGKDIANPIATILSVAMMLEYSFGEKEAALTIQKAVDSVLKKGYRTVDIFREGDTKVSTTKMGDLIVSEILG
jgi:3-isopropylmalate dehydrogenase